ncbi:MAG: NAD(P)/FAD-dependent oxidoreductase [Deltaproteobacteria bacterium]|nr:NAD(P)/FAD-dependent oxidoreductase [Deltaproteobacteria bacterium]
MKEKYDVIVVGAGLGGCVCAALLAKTGIRVLVLDKNKQVGGKAMGIDVNGFKGEMWPTYGIPSNVGPFVEAFRTLGIEEKLKPIPGTTALLYKSKGGEWIPTVNDAREKGGDPTANLFDSWGLSQEERDKSLQILAEAALLTPEQLEDLDDVSVKEWLDQHDDIPQPLFAFFANHANLMATGLYELVAMSEIVRIMQIFADPSGYPKGGYGRVIEDIAKVITDNGGVIRMTTRIERILVEDGRVSGVITGDQVYKAPIVVSNAGIQPTVMKLVGEEHFDKSYVNYVKDIVPSLGFCCQRYIFSKPVMEHGVYLATTEDSYLDIDRLDRLRDGIIPDMVNVYGVVPAHFDPDMAPPGKQMLLIGTWCSPDPRGKEIKALQKKVDEVFDEMFPLAVPYIEKREGYVGPAQVSGLSRDQVLPGLGGEAVGLAVTVGYCGKNKPNPKSPLPGLFFVGHDAGGGAYIGTNQAVSSGLRVAPVVRHYFHERKSVYRI